MIVGACVLALAWAGLATVDAIKAHRDLRRVRSQLLRTQFDLGEAQARNAAQARMLARLNPPIANRGA